MKNIWKISMLIILAVCFSCEKNGFIIKCEECIDNEPITALIDIRIYNFYGETTIDVYEGNLEDNIFYGSVTTSNENINFQVTLNKQYTVTATYETGSKTFIAVDSVHPRVRYDEEQCENPCYYIYDNKVNLVLKYMN